MAVSIPSCSDVPLPLLFLFVQVCGKGCSFVARLAVEGADLVVRLAWWEKVAARRGKVRVPLAAVQEVAIQPDWWRALRGVPARASLVVPDGLYLGVWRHPGGEDFIAVRPRHRTVIHAELRGPCSPFAGIAVSVPHSRRTLSAIRTALVRAVEDGSDGTPAGSPTLRNRHGDLAVRAFGLVGR